MSMGYTTDFRGEFNVTPTLKLEHLNYLIKFSETRRVKRNLKLCFNLPDPIREATGLPVGKEGAYFVGGTGDFGQDRDSSIIDYNKPPIGQPGLWCQWTPSKDGKQIAWDEGEKFSYYIEWIKYLIDNFLTRWEYQLNGEVRWFGEERDDLGIIIIENNNVRSDKGKITYACKNE